MPASQIFHRSKDFEMLHVSNIKTYFEVLFQRHFVNIVHVNFM